MNRIEPYTEEFTVERRVSSSMSQGQHPTTELIQNTDSNVGNVPYNEKIALKRHLGLFSAVTFIIGTIIGTGIFISPKGVLRETQSVGLCLIVWVICGLVALLGKISHQRRIGSAHARTGDMLAFVNSWANTFILQPSSNAIIILTFSSYLLSGIMDSCGPPIELVKMLAIFALVILGNVNAWSVTAANRLNIVFTVSKMATILVIAIAGLVRIGQGYTDNLKNSFHGTTDNPLRIALAFYSGLWAYAGWGSLTSVTEEVKNPKRNLWLSIVVAIPAVIILYILTNISYFTVMTKSELLSSNAVAMTWGEVVLGSVARALPILISISALGSANVSTYSYARHCMVSARYGYLPGIFSYIQKQRLTPLPAIILQAILSIIYCIPSDVDGLINYFSFVSWLFCGLTFTAVLCCRFTKRDAHRVIKVPIPLVIIMILISIYLVIAPVISRPNIGFLVASGILLISLLVYYVVVFRKMTPKFMNKLNTFIESFFNLTESQINIDT
ncbi:unnamed protein product [Adineta ricciae]|uniref:Uncharacterized protein n=1 Tax=Adineta ricciae TaxID=249248 RepID=A0A815V3U5_ADIRI|nr:unnamed protein product [Adineta ricciae]